MTNYFTSPDSTGSAMSPREFAAWYRLLLALVGMLSLGILAFYVFAPGKPPAGLTAAFTDRKDTFLWVSQILIVPTWIVARRANKVPRDERDVALESNAVRRAYQTGGVLLTVAFIGMPLYLTSSLAAHAAFWQLSGMFSGAILLCIIGALAVKNAVLIAGYRRGI